MQINTYRKLLVVAAIGIFYTNLPPYIYDNYGMIEIGALKYWVLLFCLLSLPVLVTQRTHWNAVKSPLTAWCFGYALLSVLWFILSSESDMAWQELRWRFLTIIEILTFLIIFWEPAATRLAGKTVVLAVLIGVAVNIYELFVPLSFSNLPGRSAGLYENPNTAGNALVLGMMLGVTVLNPRYRAPFILLTGIGVLVTFSRGAVLAWVIAVAGILFVGPRIRHLLISGFISVLLLALIVVPRWDQLVTIWESTGVINMDVQQRLEWFTNPFGVSDESSEQRKYLAQQAWNRAADHPFLGSGTGSSYIGTGSSYETYIATHNQYLSFMVDHGLTGALILPLLILAATWGALGEMRGFAIVFGCVLMMMSVFSNTILNTSFTLVILSIMAALAATSAHGESKSIARSDRAEERAGAAFVRV